MAKSKSGGTRSYIRGRVGADVYSIGKTASGAKQQVVRSLAETVSNPQTIAQMRGRMIMSTVMQAVAAFKPIIDHSFDGVPAGQPSISQFISRNYALVKADVENHPSSGNAFGLNEYHVKGVQNGNWVLSAGEAILPATTVYDAAAGIKITIPSTDPKLSDLMAAANITKDDYITMVALSTSKDFIFYRLKVKDSAVESTVITSSNIASLLDVEGNDNVTLGVADGVFYALPATTGVTLSDSGAVIISKKTDSGYQHNNASFVSNTDIQKPAADTVLPSYPIGTELFLNGGDL